LSPSRRGNKGTYKVSKSLHTRPIRRDQVDDKNIIDQFHTRHVTPNVHRTMGTTIIRSEKWLGPNRGSSPKTANRVLPYITKAGHISGSALLTWKSSSAQWMMTFVRLIFQKIRRRKVINKRAKKKSEDQLMRISILYAINNDERMMERLLHCRVEGFTSFFFYCLNKLSEQKRFLFGTMCKNILLLKLRGRPRAKLMKDQFVRSDGTLCHLTVQTLKNVLDDLTNQWIVGFSGKLSINGCVIW